eukprot:14495190-Alexandrium_andersonii.AAC.1
MASESVPELPSVFPSAAVGGSQQDLDATPIASQCEHPTGAEQRLRFVASCPRCQTSFSFDARPVRVAGKWPHQWCSGCRRQRRMSALECTLCWRRIP